MTLIEISNLNYILGRIEGIASMSDEPCVQNALYDTCEKLSCVLTGQTPNEVNAYDS